MEGLQPVLPIGGANNCEGGWGNYRERLLREMNSKDAKIA